MNPKPLPNPVPAKWYLSKHCEYHQGPGHLTNDCLALRHAIQDLIDQGKIENPAAPNVQTNPLPRHPQVTMIITELQEDDPVNLIRSVKGERVDTTPREGAQEEVPDYVQEWSRKLALKKGEGLGILKQGIAEPL